MANTNVKMAEKLIQDIRAKLSTCENRCMTLKGIKIFLGSDLETIEIYAETYIKEDGGTKSYPFPGLMVPRGGVEEVLRKYGVANW